MELVLTFLFSLVAPGLRILQDFAGFCRLILLKFFRVSTGWATQGRGLRIWVAGFFRRFGSRILRGFARQRRAECAFLCLVWCLGGFGAGDQTSVWRLVGQLWFSKSFCATRLKASAATVLSQRGAVMPQGQWEQDQPVKSSPSSQIKRLLMHLLPFACVWD